MFELSLDLLNLSFKQLFASKASMLWSEKTEIILNTNRVYCKSHQTSFLTSVNFICWMYGWIDGWMDERMDRKTNGRTDGWMNQGQTVNHKLLSY